MTPSARRAVPLLLFGLLLASGCAQPAPETHAYTCDRPEPPSADELETYETQRPRPGAYKGPIFATSEKVGETAPLDLFVQGAERNGVRFLIGYFFLQGDQARDDLDRDEDLWYALDAVQRMPGRIVPFYSPGFGGEESEILVGHPLVEEYLVGYDSAARIVGKDFIQGIGEVETHEWDMPHNDRRLLHLWEFADERGLQVMFHVSPGQKSAVDSILTRYPNTTFLVHMYREDFRSGRAAIEELVSAHENLYFTIDADHLLFDERNQTGLLYKYEGRPVDEAKRSFVSDFDAMRATLIEGAVSDYGPLVAARPDRITFGTEMNLPYGFEPDVYDRVFDFGREFLGRLDAEHQSLVAYENALRVFGGGVRCVAAGTS